MFSKKEVFENYLGKLGLSKTAFEAVKGINGVLFEGIDDELEEEFDDDGSATDTENVPPVGITPVPEIIEGKEEDPSVDAGGPEEAVEPGNGPSSSEFDEFKPIHFNNAYQEACKWARQEPNFNKFWNAYRAIDEISFMIPSENEGNVFYNKNTVPYVITVEGEDDVPKYEYETATNPVKMSTQVHDLIMLVYTILTKKHQTLVFRVQLILTHRPQYCLLMQTHVTLRLVYVRRISSIGKPFLRNMVCQSNTFTRLCLKNGLKQIRSMYWMRKHVRSMTLQRRR